MMYKMLSAAAMFLCFSTVSAQAGEEVQKGEYILIIKEHKFSPEKLEVPAGEKVRLLVRNEDPSPEEFESFDLHREKIIPGGSEAAIFVGPLEPGTYSFFGEFNPDTAQGTLIAR